MKQFYKILCLLLIVCFVGTAFAACSEQETTSETPSVDNQEGNKPPEEDENKFRLEKEDFGGVVIKVLTDKASDYLACEIAPKELNNEPVNDAAYNRAALLAQEYGIVLEQHYADKKLLVNINVTSVEETTEMTLRAIGAV